MRMRNDGELIMDEKNIGVHRTHCCKFHGCKYGDPDCPVENKTIEQDYPCEDCDGTDAILLKSISEQVLYLCNFIICSESRMPYTYHHDYLREYGSGMGGMSRSDIAALEEFSIDELYSIAFLQLIEHRSGADIIISLNSDIIDIAKNVVNVGQRIFNEKYA